MYDYDTNAGILISSNSSICLLWLKNRTKTRNVGKQNFCVSWFHANFVKYYFVSLFFTNMHFGKVLFCVYVAIHTYTFLQKKGQQKCFIFVMGVMT